MMPKVYLLLFWEHRKLKILTWKKFQMWRLGTLWKMTKIIMMLLMKGTRNDWEDIGKINFMNMESEGMQRFHFANRSVAFELYNSYAKRMGFAGRKSHTRKYKGVIRVQNFVCSHEGFHPEKYRKMQNRKKEPRVETRCGCPAMMQVRLDMSSGRWIVSQFSKSHNQEYLAPIYTSMLSGHRKMTEGDICGMNNMRKGGVAPCKIYGALASSCGGHHNIGFLERDMYNKLARQRRILPGVAQAALEYLNGLRVTDPLMFIRHEVDGQRAIRNIFWCDGVSQLGYSVFGDVLAFDATYKKNVHRIPLVVFFGVNNHNRTVVFAAALVCDESEETYVWLLQRLLEAMNGKQPVSVITDGALAMKNAIDAVLPNAHHRLCAWHLIQNATRFTQLFKKCMLGDYEICVFCRKWFQMVEEFGVQEKRWIIDMYDNMEAWATAHIRGIDGRFNSARDWAIDTVKKWQREDATQADGCRDDVPTEGDGLIRDALASQSHRKSQHCSLCGQQGHNHVTCPVGRLVKESGGLYDVNGPVDEIEEEIDDALRQELALL